MTGQRIAITGSSGLIGGALSSYLRERRDVVVPIRRAAQVPADALPLVPGDERVRRELADGLAQCDAVVNLAGAPIGKLPWTQAYRQELRSSRLTVTGELVAALAQSASPTMVVSASAHGIYGDGGETVLTESAPLASGFLPSLCRDWEKAALRASSSGHRVALLRTSLVLAGNAGALKPLQRLTRYGLNGPLGGGRQWWSWISLQDQVRAIAHVIDEQLSGPINMTTPRAIRQRDFAAAMGRSARRPAILPAPALALRAALGDFAPELTDSRRLRPDALLTSGFVWHEDNLDQVLDRAFASPHTAV